MSEAAPAYVSDSAPPRPAGCRMRQTTWVAANRVRMMTRIDGVFLAEALKLAGISSRSYQRFLAEIEGGPRRVTAHLEVAPAKCLPLFDQTARLAAVEAKAEQALKRIDGICDRLIRAAGMLHDAAHELSDWLKN